MKNLSLSLLVQVAVAIIAVFALLFTLNRLKDEEKEVRRLNKENQELQKELYLCTEEKLELQQDTAQLRSHADKSFSAMSVFLGRLISQGDGKWVAEQVGILSLQKEVSLRENDGAVVNAFYGNDAPEQAQD